GPRRGPAQSSPPRSRIGLDGECGSPCSLRRRRSPRALTPEEALRRAVGKEPRAEAVGRVVAARPVDAARPRVERRRLVDAKVARLGLWIERRARTLRRSRLAQLDEVGGRCGSEAEAEGELTHSQVMAGAQRNAG